MKTSLDPVRNGFNAPLRKRRSYVLGKSRDSPQAIAQSCLPWLNPNCDHDTWFRILAAGKSADDSSAMREIFRAWSMGGESYNERDFDATWRSIKPNRGIGLGTLIHLAKEAGWTGMGNVCRKSPSRPVAARSRPSLCNAPFKQVQMAKALPPPSATYYYVNEQGEQLYRKRRYDKGILNPDRKVFMFERYEDGAWIGGKDCLAGVRRVLYRLDQFDRHQQIFIVEGEKCADALGERGQLATCNDDGAGKWRDEYSLSLIGKDVVILPDNDEPGRDHADFVARSLWGHAKTIKILELPGLEHKQDVYDWLNATKGTMLMNSTECLTEMANQQAEWTPTGNTNAETGQKSGIVLPPTDFKPFPCHLLPDPIRSYIESGAKAIGCDPAYLAVPMLPALAAAIGNTRRIRLKQNWSEPSTIWAAIVGASGTHKSPALDTSLRPIQKRQDHALLQLKDMQKDYKRDLMEYERAKADWKNRRKGEGDPPLMPDEPTPERIIVNDVTIEALAQLLQENSRGLLLVRDELAGWFGSFDQYRGGRGADDAHWLTMHRAGDLKVDRKGGNPRTLYVPHASVSITGGIQPEILKGCLKQDYWANGLAARILLTMPPSRPKKWTDEDLDSSLEQQMYAVFERLFSLEFHNPVTLEPELIPLSKSAKVKWEKFYNENGKEQHEFEQESENDLAAYWSKLEGYAARFALVIHLARWAADDLSLVSDEEIDDFSIDAGIQLSRWFGEEMKRIYTLMGESAEERDQREILEAVCRYNGRIATRDLMHAMRKYRHNADEAYKALDSLVNAGLGHWEVTQGSKGRPPQIFVLNQ